MGTTLITIPHGGSVLGSLLGMLLVLAWRVREARGPVTMKKIVIPPAGMATGMCMFFVPAFRVPWTWGVTAVLVGAAILAYPLIRTTKLHRDGEQVLMRRSNAFFLVIIALAIIRFAARAYLDTLLTIPQTGALFYLLAFGMIVRWRAQMYRDYRALAPSFS